MHLDAGKTRRRHPFGGAANWLVLAGTSLSIIQSVVVAIAAVLAPINQDFELVGFGLLLWLVVGAGLPVGVGWAAWRALRSWWRRSLSVVGRVYVAALLAIPSSMLLGVPLDDDFLLPVAYFPAGVLMALGAFVARPRVLAAAREGRGGLSD